MENKLQEQIKVLLDKAEDKELIDALVNINNTANEMISEHDQLLAKHDERLIDVVVFPTPPF